jgi:hypothetical protein
MSNSSYIFYTVYFEGDGLTALSDWFGGKQSINRMLHNSQDEAVKCCFHCNRACIVYNASNQSYLNSMQCKGYSPTAINDLVKWAKKNIPLVIATVAINRAKSIHIKAPAPAPAEPAPAEPAPADHIKDPEQEPPQWSFYEHSTINYQQMTLDVNVEIGNIAEKVCSAIRAYGGDFFAIADLAKGITLKLGVGLTSEKGTNEYIGQIAEKEATVSYVLIKFVKSISSTKIKVGGLFGSSKKASRFDVTYSLFKPKNNAAKIICDALLDTKIQYKLNALKDA